MTGARRGVVAVALFFGLVACEALDEKGGYYRHSMSSFRESRTQPGILEFEVTTATRSAEEGTEAEAERIRWLEDWLKQTGACPAGYRIVSREPIDPGEVNPRGHDLRYRLRCSGGN